MREPPLTPYGTRVLTAAAILLVSIAVSSAQRTTVDNASEGAPVATNAIVQNPDAYDGKRVTVSAGVEQVLSRTAFLLDQRRVVTGQGVKSTGAPILVIAPYLTGAVDQKNYLVVRGEIVKFAPGVIARVAPDYTLDLSPEMWTRYEGQPVLVATSVRDFRYVEMGMKPLPPARPEELSMSAAMKVISAALADLRSATQEAKTETVTRNAAKLQPAFAETETIWVNLRQDKAAAWAREARGHAASIERAATAANWDAVKTSTGALDQLCQNCHGAYREPQEDGTFRFKAGL